MTACLPCKIKLAAGLIFTVTLFSCKKDISSTQADFVAARNGFLHNFSDSLTLNAYTIKMDSIPTNGLTRHVIGRFNDQLTGEMSATFIHQIALPVNQFSWNGAQRLDSLVLRLRLTSTDNFFGYPNTPRVLKAYLLDEDLYWDSLYFSSRPPKLKTPGIEIGSFNGVVNIQDTLKTILGSKQLNYPPCISITMNQQFKDYFYGAEQRGEFINTGTFKQAFKGIVVTDETNDAPGSGCIFFINPRSVNSALYAYYDTIVTEFAINDKQEVVYNYFNHADKLQQFLQNSFTGSHRDTALLVPLAGARLRLEIPDLFEKLGGKNVVINAATITFKVLDGSDVSPYKLPNRLSFFASDSLGRNGFIRDNILETDAFFGGFLNTADKTYTFNFTRHLQFLLNSYKQNRNLNYGFHLLIPSDNPVSASRVLIDTRKNIGSIKLKLNYTVVN